MHPAKPGVFYQNGGTFPARRELRKFATTFYALHKKSSLTCSAAPRFKPVTASAGSQVCAANVGTDP